MFFFYLPFALQWDMNNIVACLLCFWGSENIQQASNTTNGKNTPTFYIQGMEGCVIKNSAQTKFYPKRFYDDNKFIFLLSW